MSEQTLAVKYRPQDFEDVMEQGSIKTILRQQLETGTIKNVYLFCGGAGTGKTTCARIFANEINNGQGNPIEMDAASHNGVDDVRSIIQQAKTKSIDSEYKVFIIDECHSISNTGWQAFLKLIEEPPAKSIFIFCTTDPQKIPKTILSRVQRYDFQRISHAGIVRRLTYIINAEQNKAGEFSNIDPEAIDYIAKIADGGMRDAITMMDKCLAYNPELTLQNVVNVLGTAEYDDMLTLTDKIIEQDTKEVISIIEQLYLQGKELKQFVKLYLQFLLDVQKVIVGCDWKYINIPKLDQYTKWLQDLDDYDIGICFDLLDLVMQINAEIKYSSSVKYDIEAYLVRFIEGGRK